MRRVTVVGLSVFLCSICGLVGAGDGDIEDWRDVEHGSAVPTPGMRYVDQPYPLKLKDGTWLCMLTVGPEAEGKPGVHSAALLSGDQGRTWSAPVRCGGSYAVPFLTPTGRIYALRPANFSYSDDQGRSWSEPVAVPKTVSTIQGKGGWSVAKPVVVRDELFVPWAYIGLSRPPRKTEVFFNVSDNLLFEGNPSNVRWRRTPAAEQGLRGPDWDNPEHRSEEPHLVTLSDGSLYTVWRTDQGFIGMAISRDFGTTWSKPDYVRFADGRPIKHPLACPSLWKCSNGKFLLWIHHHNHNSLKRRGNPYRDRNPAWICGGMEQNGTILWSQPEIVLYSDDLSYGSGRISYPGFLEDNDRYWIFETQKTRTRLHEIDAGRLNAVWSQFNNKSGARNGLVSEFGEEKIVKGNLPMPKLPNLSTGGGFSIELLFKIPAESTEAALLDSRIGSKEGAKGIRITCTRDGTIRLSIYDGANTAHLDSDPGLLKPGTLHHAVLILDGGPKIISLVFDGRLCDGGESRQYGWARLGQVEKDRVVRPVGDVNAAETLTVAPVFQKHLKLIRFYDRYLLTSEAIGNYRAVQAAANSRSAETGKP